MWHLTIYFLNFVTRDRGTACGPNLRVMCRPRHISTRPVPTQASRCILLSTGNIVNSAELNSAEFSKYRNYLASLFRAIVPIDIDPFPFSLVLNIFIKARAPAIPLPFLSFLPQLPLNHQSNHRATRRNHQKIHLHRSAMYLHLWVVKKALL